MKAFLRSMTIRAMAFTRNVSTNSTSPAAMYAPALVGVSNSAALLAIFEAKVSPPENSENAERRWQVRQDQGDGDGLAERAAEAEHGRR